MPTVATQTVAMGPDTVSSYFDLASWIDSRERMAIFQSFGDLDLLNLLILQAELHQLRIEFKAACVKEPPVTWRGYLPPNFSGNRPGTGGNRRSHCGKRPENIKASQADKREVERVWYMERPLR
jgi:hypothetical protein